MFRRKSPNLYCLLFLLETAQAVITVAFKLHLQEVKPTVTLEYLKHLVDGFNGQVILVSGTLDGKTPLMLILKTVKSDEQALFIKNEYLASAKLQKKGVDMNGVVKVYGYGKARGEDISGKAILMEFMPSKDLKSLEYGSVVIPAKEMLSIGLELVNICEHLLKAGITHGDIKPSNLFFRNPSTKSRLALSDFGLATFVGSPVTIEGIRGTHRFMSSRLQIVENVKAIPADDLRSLIYVLCLPSLRGKFDWDPECEQFCADGTTYEEQIKLIDSIRQKKENFETNLELTGEIVPELKRVLLAIRNFVNAKKVDLDYSKLRQIFTEAIDIL